MRCLIADDDRIARTLIGAVLRDLKHECTQADDGLRAWELFQATPFPLVVLDINMPGIDGLELSRRIRKHPAGASTFIVICTARDGPEDLGTVLDAGADDYVTKPSSPEQLRARFEIARQRIGKDDARRTAEAELARSRWLAGIGETTIALEHEINNPLSALIGHAELLLMDASINKEQEDQLRIIHEEAGRIAAVVRRLARLKNPESVEYLAGSRMIDLSAQKGTRD